MSGAAGFGGARQRLAAIAFLLGFAITLGRAAAGCANGDATDAAQGGGDDDASTQPGDEGGTSDGSVDDGTSPCGDLQNDPKNCGVCGNTCASNNICQNGRCVLGCAPPKSLCGGGDGGNAPSDAAADGDADPDAATFQQPFCTDLSNDDSNCGQCGVVCGAQHKCIGGKCTLTCDPGTSACPSADMCIPTGTCCTNADCTMAGSQCATPGQACTCVTVDTFATSCAAATQLGTLALGQTVTKTGNLPTMTSENWFSVTFAGNTSTSPAYHPHVQFTTNTNNNFAFDIMNGCGSATALTCGEAGSTCTSKTDWEVTYNMAASPAPDPNSPGFQPIAPVGANGTVWIRVVRVAGTPNCDPFTLSVSN